MSKLLTFTVLTEETPGYFNMRESAKRWGWDVRAFFFPGHAYHDFIAAKHRLMREVLGMSVHTCKKFMFVDAWDTLFLGPPSELDFEPGTLNFSGSLDCYPNKGYEKLAPKGTMPYLNSGVMWGDIEVFLDHCPKEKVNDQLAWWRAYVDFPWRLRIDTEARTALTIFGEKDLTHYSRQGGRWTYTPTMSKPLVVHAGGKWPMPGGFLQ